MIENYVRTKDHSAMDSHSSFLADPLLMLDYPRVNMPLVAYKLLYMRDKINTEAIVMCQELRSHGIPLEREIYRKQSTIAIGIGVFVVIVINFYCIADCNFPSLWRT
ncbi:Uncharacterized protein Fot_16652 [Forsythia ovata]|uniref:Uncharacterized protein n=1 Tax=Forsythia ovata TaxID=205694 RepID=A0ABD1VD42_9LAMI